MPDMHQGWQISLSHMLQTSRSGVDPNGSGSMGIPH